LLGSNRWILQESDESESLTVVVLMKVPFHSPFEEAHDEFIRNGGDKPTIILVSQRERDAFRSSDSNYDLQGRPCRIEMLLRDDPRGIVIRGTKDATQFEWPPRLGLGEALNSTL